MTITEKSLKLLWANSAGFCSFPGCNTKLSIAVGEGVTPYILGEMAHIKGNKLGSNRYDKFQLPIERDSYENLILLCAHHHSLIDKSENESKYSIEYLHKIKEDHEARIANQLVIEKIENIQQLKDKISIYLAENFQVWQQYGPESDNAKKFPNNEQIHILWKSMRLTKIVPNNREMKNILNKNRSLFTIEEQQLVSKFILHVESYEEWVYDRISYDAILGFPVEFNKLIRG